MKKAILLFCVVALICSCASTKGDKVYSFSKEAEEDLIYIGTNLKNRNVVAVGSDNPDSTHEATVDWILSSLLDAGYNENQIDSSIVNVEKKTKKGTVTYPVQNIVLTVEGKDISKQIIVLAHYDGDGVGDNGSGLALLLSTAVGLEGVQPECNVKYVFADAEEVGLIGAKNYAESLTEEEVKSTLFMINIDSIAFGDYPNLYGGVQGEDGTVTALGAYNLAQEKAKKLGINTYTTSDLDGYYQANGTGPAIEENTLYTNPWTLNNPAPKNAYYLSPSTGDWSDHAPYKKKGIEYIYMEATNWFAEGDGGRDAYTGYFESYDSTLGYDGMFMNTEYDTLENLTSFFPGRSKAHFDVYSPLLCSLIINPLGV